MSTVTFGRARAQKAESAASKVRLIDPSMLPDKGICFHMNHLRRMWQATPPEFPEPIHISARKIAWPEEVIDDWINQKIAAAKLKKKSA